MEAMLLVLASSYRSGDRRLVALSQREQATGGSSLMNRVMLAMYHVMNDSQMAMKSGKTCDR